jgi:soluble lytic murein transglycosylase-like protein
MFVCSFVALPAQCGGIFVSIAADGSARYATAPLDATYRPLFHEAAVAHALTSSVDRELNAIVERVARRHKLAPSLIAAVARVESRFNPRAQSRKGAVGAMQVMPATAAQYGVSRGQLFDLETNIDTGARHLKELLARFKGNEALALAAYNAGEESVRRNGSRIPPYAETMLYVPSVLATAATATQKAQQP